MQAMNPRAFLAIFFATAVGASALFLALIIVIDPYGTGRLTPIKRTDIADDDNNYANVARLRDPRFNAAIIGNSRSMRLAPHRLNEMTRLSFVMLAMPGLDPQTQITVAQAFIRSHKGRGVTLVWGLGDEWCRTHHEPIPFPRWLYEPSEIQYVRHLLTPRATRTALRRVLIMIGLRRPEGTLDGYEPDHPFWNRETDLRTLATIAPSSEGEPVDAPMPLIQELAQFARNSSARLIFIFQPVFANYAPIAGSPAEMRLNRCKAQLQRLPGAFIDMQAQSKLVSDPSSFLDAGHFRDNVAREVERHIADAIATDEYKS